MIYNKMPQEMQYLLRLNSTFGTVFQLPFTLAQTICLVLNKGSVVYRSYKALRIFSSSQRLTK